MDPDEPANEALLDLATNLLAVILIVTLFSLISVPHRQQGSPHPAARSIVAEPFVEPRRDLFPPFSRFYFVVGDRVVRWDQEAVVTARLAEPRRLTGTTHQGRFEWLPEPLVTRDIDTFQMRFFVDAAAVSAHEPPFTESAAARLLLDLLEGHAVERTAPVFIVYPDGLETFARFYDSLRASGIRFRWFTHQPGEPLFLGRHPAQFTHHAIYW
ncbi:hypothetical protein ABC977_07640 [Thioalkalicoccus limnaeus]|uniref:Biopolymer transporter ExbD n=1 Tax=Thioalkalicoccus limnaeus TaxID=120681 RepID=A0ABV4BG13_9GAMM